MRRDFNEFNQTDASWSGTIFDSSAYQSDTSGGSTSCTYNYFQGNTDNLLGKVLTIIDASYAEPAQRDAVKSLIKEVFSNYRSPTNWTYAVTGTDGSITVS